MSIQTRNLSKGNVRITIELRQKQFDLLRFNFEDQIHPCLDVLKKHLSKWLLDCSLSFCRPLDCPVWADRFCHNFFKPPLFNSAVRIDIMCAFGFYLILWNICMNYYCLPCASSQFNVFYHLYCFSIGSCTTYLWGGEGPYWIYIWSLCQIGWVPIGSIFQRIRVSEIAQLRSIPEILHICIFDSCVWFQNEITSQIDVSVLQLCIFSPYSCPQYWHSLCSLMNSPSPFQIWLI